MRQSLLVLTLAVACGDATESPDGAIAPDAAPDAVVSRSAVTGSRLITYLTDTGEVVEPESLAGATIEAILPDGAGGFTVIPGVGAADGSFEIPDVPEGAYYLHLGTNWIHTTSHTVDLGEARLGRPDVVPTTMATPVVFDVTGLSPWETDDTLEAVSSNAGMFVFAAEYYGTPAPMVGASALTGLTMDWYGDPFPRPGYLIDGGAGDRLSLVQLERRLTASGEPYEGLTRHVEFAPFTMVDGVSTTLAGALAPVPQTTLDIEWPMAEFAALGDAVHPNSVDYAGSFYVSPQPGGLAHGVVSANPDLVRFFLAPGWNVNLSGMSYGNPFPATWETYASVSMIWRVTYTVGSIAYPAYGYVGHIDEVAAVAATPIVPRLSPPLAPYIAGLDARVLREGVGLTPSLSWSAPSLGTAVGYRIFVYRLYMDIGILRRSLVAVIKTTSTAIVIPPSILAAGETYHLGIQAVAGDFDLANHPHRTPFPMAYADALTALVRP